MFALLILVSIMPPINSILQPSSIVMDSNFKWGADVHPTWTSVFTGSNDVNPHFPFIHSQLSSFSQTKPLELVTVIGGGAYLKLMESTNFTHIHFFDANINELTKLRTLHQYIIDHDYTEWIEKGASYTSNQFINNPRDLYLPHQLHQDGVQFRTASDFVWPIPSVHFFYNEQIDPLWTLLSYTNYPQYQWQPTEKGYQNVKAMLSNPSVVSTDFHLSLPSSVTLPSSIAIVYVNGATKISESMISAVSSSALAISIRSLLPNDMVDDCAGVQCNDLIKGMQWWKDSHLWWEFVVRQEMILFNQKENGATGTKGITSFQIWAEEDLEFVNTIYDWFFTETSIDVNRYISTNGQLNHANSITLHMLLSKTQTNEALHVEEQCLQRTNALINVLQIAMKSEETKVLFVTEHNAAADPFTSNQKKYPCVIDADRLVQLINRSIQAIGAMFAVQTVRYIPPNNRNVLISLERINRIEKEPIQKDVFMEDVQPSLAIGTTQKSSPVGTFSISIDGDVEIPVFIPLEGTKQNKKIKIPRLNTDNDQTTQFFLFFFSFLL